MPETQETLIEIIANEVRQQKKEEVWGLVAQVASLRFDLDRRVYQLVRAALEDRQTYDNLLPILLDDVVGYHQKIEVAFEAMKKAYKAVTGEEYTGSYPDDVLPESNTVPPADGSE